MTTKLGDEMKVKCAVPHKGLTAPRTLQQAFGPYATWPKNPNKTDHLIGYFSALIVVGAITAVLLGY